MLVFKATSYTRASTPSSTAWRSQAAIFGVDSVRRSERHGIGALNDEKNNGPVSFPPEGDQFTEVLLTAGGLGVGERGLSLVTRVQFFTSI